MKGDRNVIWIRQVHFKDVYVYVVVNRNERLLVIIDDTVGGRVAGRQRQRASD